MIGKEDYITRSEFEKHAQEVNNNLQSIKDAINEYKILRNCSVSVAAGFGSGVMYILLNFLKNGGHW